MNILKDPNGKGCETVKVSAFNLFGFIVLCTTCLVVCTGEAVVPHHLLGVWKTSEPRFAGCKIEFLERGLILGLKDGVDEYHAIKKIESVEERGRSVWYTIHSKDSEGQESKLSFLYDPLSGGTLRLKNHPEIWKRIDSKGTEHVILEKTKIPHQ